MNFSVRHRTVYKYQFPVSVCYNRVHLIPRDHAYQSCSDAALHVSPEPAAIERREDYFGNTVAFFSLLRPHQSLEVTATSTIRSSVPVVPQSDETPRWAAADGMLRGDLSPRGLEAVEFSLPSPYVPRSAALREYALPSFPPDARLLDGVRDLMARIHSEFTYKPQVTNISTPVEQVLRQRKGVCQDFAHLMIGCLRNLGLAARYVSGYLLTRPPEGQEKLVGADESHAWVGVYFPGFGWVDFDPTNNQLPGGEHISIGWGRDFGDVSPMRGISLGGGKQTLKVEVDVTPADNGAIEWRHG